MACAYQDYTFFMFLYRSVQLKGCGLLRFLTLNKKGFIY